VPVLPGFPSLKAFWRTLLRRDRCATGRATQGPNVPASRRRVACRVAMLFDVNSAADRRDSRRPEGTSREANRCQRMPVAGHETDHGLDVAAHACAWLRKRSSASSRSTSAVASCVARRAAATPAASARPCARCPLPNERSKGHVRVARVARLPEVLAAHAARPHPVRSSRAWRSARDQHANDLPARTPGVPLDAQLTDRGSVLVYRASMRLYLSPCAERTESSPTLG
jgi:hypothetical protein